MYVCVHWIDYMLCGAHVHYMQPSLSHILRRHDPTTRARRHDARARAPALLLREHDDPGAALLQGQAKDPAAARKLQLDLDARARFMQDMVFSTLLD